MAKKKSTQGNGYMIFVYIILGGLVLAAVYYVISYTLPLLLGGVLIWIIRKSASDGEQKSKYSLIVALVSFIALPFWLLFGVDAFLGNAPDEIEDIEEKIEQVQGVENKAEKEEERHYYELVKVIDGDTIKIKDQNEEITVRLLTIDAPEMNPIQCYANESKNYLINILASRRIYLKKDTKQGDLDSFGRTLAYVFTSNDMFINKEMVENGYAIVYTDKDSDKMNDFLELESMAKESKKGIWSGVCDCGKGDEKNRSCYTCNLAKVVYTNWDCSTYSGTVKDTSCSYLCVQPDTSSSTLKKSTCLYSCISPDRDCSDFNSHSQAQQFFQCCGFTASNDPMRLDGDGDGIACESI